MLAAAALLMPAAGAAPAPPKTIAVNGLTMTGVVWEPKTIPVNSLVMTGVVWEPKTIPVNGLVMTGDHPGAAGTPRR